MQANSADYELHSLLNETSHMSTTHPGLYPYKGFCVLNASKAAEIKVQVSTIPLTSFMRHTSNTLTTRGKTCINVLHIGTISNVICSHFLPLNTKCPCLLH